MSRLTRKTNGKDYCLYCDCIEKENEIFEKRQKLLSPEEYYKEEPYTMEDSYYLEDAMNKLGKLEDLMDEYNINAIEELKNILGSYFIAGGFRSGGKTIVAKGMLYNILSEQLGCPLEVFVGIMLGKITEIVVNYSDACGYDSLYEELVSADVSGIIESYEHRCLCVETNLCDVPIKDYQKNWWLKGEKVNDD